MTLPVGECCGVSHFDSLFLSVRFLGFLCISSRHCHAKLVIVRLISCTCLLHVIFLKDNYECIKIDVSIQKKNKLRKTRLIHSTLKCVVCLADKFFYDEINVLTFVLIKSLSVHIIQIFSCVKIICKI